jgi:hypothetical protein
MSEARGNEGRFVNRDKVLPRPVQQQGDMNRENSGNDRSSHGYPFMEF